MSSYTCGHCLFAEEHDSSDVIHCWILKELRKINDYPCGRFKNGKDAGLSENPSTGY